MSTQIRMPGKGSRRRPTAVQADTFASNWERTFGKQQETPTLPSGYWCADHDGMCHHRTSSDPEDA